MKNKIIASVLTVTTLIASLVAPVSAQERSKEFESSEYYQNYLGDSIVSIDSEGYITCVEPFEGATYDAASAAAIITSAGGAMGVGSGAILSAALPVLGYLLAAGVVIYSVNGLVDSVMDLYFLLSEAAQAECADIVDSGATSFTPSAQLQAELNAAIGEVFFTDDGTFISSGITFDPSNMLEYNADAQFVYGADLTSSIYKYALTNSPVSFAGTSLSLSLVTSPFMDEYNECMKAFRLVNAVTGAALTFMTTADTEFLTRSHCTYSVSAPVVETMSDWSSGEAYHTMGFWVLSECSIIAGGEHCSECNVRYSSEYFGEADSMNENMLALFTGTGVEAIDNIFFDYQAYTAPNTWELSMITPFDGMRTATIPNSAITTLSSDLVYTMAQAEDFSATVDQTVYIPGLDALTDANKLTQNGALTGDYTTVLENPAVDSPTVEVPGLLSLVDGVLEGVTSVVSGVGDMLFGAGDFIATIPDFFASVLDIFMFWKEPDAHGAVGH